MSTSTLPTPTRSYPSRLLPRLLGPRASYREPSSMGVALERAAERFGRVPVYLSKPFELGIEQDRVNFDYADLATLVQRLSGAFAAAGVQPWDRVAIVKTPNYDSLMLAFAVARLGAIPVLMSARLDGETLAMLLSRLHSPYVFTDQATMEASRLPENTWRELSRRLIGAAPGAIPLEDLYGAQTPPPAPRTGEEPMLITHTSSTTGIPKLVENTVAGASGVVKIESMRWPFGHSTSDLLATCISFVHLRGTHSTMAILARGTSYIALSDPDVETVGKLLSRFKPTMTEAHPNTYMDWEPLCTHPGKPFSRVRIFFNTFDAAHPRTIQKLLSASERRNAVYSQGYGLSEVGVLTFRVYTRGQARRLGHATNSRNLGWPMPGVRLRIVDPRTQRRLPLGQTGMIQAKTKMASVSFIGQPAKYWARKHGQWFDTGDYGRRTRLGSLEMLDREIDRIDGVDSCIWIEDVLLTRLPELREIVVVADSQGRPIPVAMTYDGEPVDPARWRHASADLPLPLEPHFIDESELPRTATVKARRFLLSQLVSGVRDIEPDIRLREGA